MPAIRSKSLLATRAEGADELVFLDITASHEGRAIMLDVVRRTAEVVFMPLTVGGGIRTIDDIRALLERRQRQGVDQFGRRPRSGVRPPGGPAIRQPVHRREYRPQAGAQRRPRILGSPYQRRADRHRPGGGRLGPRGRAAGGRRNRADLHGCRRHQNGYDLEITAAVSRAVSIPVVASGGAGRPEHLADAIRSGQADAALAAGIFHFGEYTIAKSSSTCTNRAFRSDCGHRARKSAGLRTESETADSIA